jgi:hypothetical protein
VSSGWRICSWVERWEAAVLSGRQPPDYLVRIIKGG